MRKRIGAFDVVNTIILAFATFVTVFPFWYVFVISVSTGTSYVQDRMHFWPRVINFDEYKRVLQAGELIKTFSNSVIVTATGTILALLVTICCAYALSRKRLMGKKIIIPYVMFTMFFSAGLIPYYLLVTSLGLKNSLWALILPMLTNVYYMMIMRTYLGAIPDSLEESAKLDGASDYRILATIIIPTSKPMIAAIGLFFAVQYYNDYFNPLLFISTRSKYTLQFLLRELVVNNLANNSSVGGSSTTTTDIFKMASVLLSVLPILAVYPFLQRYFVQGMMLGSIKE